MFLKSRLPAVARDISGCKTSCLPLAESNLLSQSRSLRPIVFGATTIADMDDAVNARHVGGALRRFNLRQRACGDHLVFEVVRRVQVAARVFDQTEKRAALTDRTGGFFEERESGGRSRDGDEQQHADHRAHHEQTGGGTRREGAAGALICVSAPRVQNCCLDVVSHRLQSVNFRPSAGRLFSDSSPLRCWRLACRFVWRASVPRLRASCQTSS